MTNKLHLKKTSDNTVHDAQYTSWSQTIASLYVFYCVIFLCYIDKESLLHSLWCDLRLAIHLVYGAMADHCQSSLLTVQSKIPTMIQQFLLFIISLILYVC